MSQHLRNQIRQEEAVKRAAESRLARLLFLRETGLLVSLGQDDIEDRIQGLQDLIERQDSKIELLTWLLNT